MTKDSSAESLDSHPPKVIIILSTYSQNGKRIPDRKISKLLIGRNTT